VWALASSIGLRVTNNANAAKVVALALASQFGLNSGCISARRFETRSRFVCQRALKRICFSSKNHATKSIILDLIIFQQTISNIVIEDWANKARLL
jgi:hypothetical protein